MIQKKIKFICKRDIEAPINSLVINVGSIEKLYPNGFKAFYLSNIQMACTNGFIVVITDNNTFPHYMFEVINKILKPMNFREGGDYVYGRDYSSPENFGSPIGIQTLDWCFDADKWLNSYYSREIGSLVCHKSFDSDLEDYANTIEAKHYWTQYWTFWYNKHPILKDVKLTRKGGDSRFLNLDRKRYEIVENKIIETANYSSIPLIVGSQFGLNPKLESLFTPDYIGFAAVLSKSALSGTVSGLSIYIIEDLKLSYKLLYIENTTGTNQKLNDLSLNL